jgi:hypothetical protein
MAINLEIVPEMSIPEFRPVLAEITPIVKHLKKLAEVYDPAFNVIRQPGTMKLNL